MNFKNPIHEAVYKHVVKPTMNARKMSVEASIMRVNYEKQTARVYWRDPDSGAERQTENVPIQIEGDGVYKRALEEGDRVTLSFRNGNHMNPYITMVHERKKGVNFESKNGAGIPKGMGFM